MNPAAIREGIARIAARAVLGRPPRQPEPTAPPPEQGPPPPDAIHEARQTLATWAGRLSKLEELRRELDLAADAERTGAAVDLAAIVERGDDLPDAGAMASRKARAETVLRATWQLVTRDAGHAFHSLHAVRSAAVAAVREATEAAQRAVGDSLPPYFTGEALGRVIAESSPVKECHRAKLAVDRLALQTLPVVKSDFGLGWKLPAWRITERPAKGKPDPDRFDIGQALAAIEAVLAVHTAAIGFSLNMHTQPETATWPS